MGNIAFDRWSNLDKRNFVFPFMKHHYDIFDAAYTQKLNILKKCSRKMMRKESKYRPLYKTHVEEIYTIFEKTDFYKLLNEKDLLRKVGFIMLIQRDILVEKFVREEDVLRDFHERDEYFQHDKSEKRESQKKGLSPKKNQTNDDKNSVSSGNGQSDNSNSEDDDFDDSDGEGRRNRRNKKSKRNKKKNDFYEDDDDEFDVESEGSVVSVESSMNSTFYENQQIEDQMMGSSKPFLIRLFEEFGRKKFEKMHMPQLEAKMKQYLCWFASMVEMDSEILGMLFRTTRHLRFNSQFGNILMERLLDMKENVTDLFMNQTLINILIAYLFERLGEAIDAVNSDKLSKFFISILELYNFMKSNKIFMIFLKKRNKLDEFEKYKHKLDFFRILSIFNNKLLVYFSQKQLQVFYSILWKADNLGIIFFQNISELKQTNEVIMDLQEKEEAWAQLSVSKNLMDIFVGENDGTGMNLKKLVNEYLGQGQIKNKSDDAVKKNLNKMRTQLRTSSQHYSSIAERFIVLAVLTKMDKDPNFQEMLFHFFKGFVGTILEDKLFLTYQGNFSQDTRKKIDEEELEGESQIVNLFGVFLKLSKNMLRMINFVIDEVKKNKRQYRKMLSYLHSLKNHKFITVMIDKLTQTEIATLLENEDSNPLITYIKNDRIKESEIDIVQSFDEDIANGRNYKVLLKQ
jgi:hypothetical protein